MRIKRSLCRLLSTLAILNEEPCTAVTLNILFIIKRFCNNIGSDGYHDNENTDCFDGFHGDSPPGYVFLDYSLGFACEPRTLAAGAVCSKRSVRLCTV